MSKKPLLGRVMRSKASVLGRRFGEYAIDYQAKYCFSPESPRQPSIVTLSSLCPTVTFSTKRHPFFASLYLTVVFLHAEPSGQGVLEKRNAWLGFPVGPGGQSAPKCPQVARAVMVRKDLVFQEQRGHLLFRGWLDIPFAEQPVKLFEHALVFIWMV